MEKNSIHHSGRNCHFRPFACNDLVCGKSWWKTERQDRPLGAIKSIDGIQKQKNEPAKRFKFKTKQQSSGPPPKSLKFPGKVRFSFDVENFPILLGVIVFSYTSQIFLPTLEGSMVDPSKFSWMLDWSHIAAAAFKSLFGYLCFLTFQDDTQQVITNNLHSTGFKGLVNVFLYIKALLSYPLPYYAACDLLERAFFRSRPKTIFPTIWALDGELKVWGLAFRVGIVVATVMMAISIPHFAILMGFIGNFTGTMLSFIWPCYFHLKLKRDQLDRNTILYDYFIIFLGLLFLVVGVYDSGSALIKAFKIGLPF